jgi:hypothetical protein
VTYVVDDFSLTSSTRCRTLLWAKAEFFKVSLALRTPAAPLLLVTKKFNNRQFQVANIKLPKKKGI